MYRRRSAAAPAHLVQAATHAAGGRHASAPAPVCLPLGLCAAAAKKRRPAVRLQPAPRACGVACGERERRRAALSGQALLQPTRHSCTTGIMQRPHRRLLGGAAAPSLCGRAEREAIVSRSATVGAGTACMDLQRDRGSGGPSTIVDREEARAADRPSCQRMPHSGAASARCCRWISASVAPKPALLRHSQSPTPPVHFACSLTHAERARLNSACMPRSSTALHPLAGCARSGALPGPCL